MTKDRSASRSAAIRSCVVAKQSDSRVHADVDFRAARRQLDGLADVSAGIRHRALAAYVALFDYVTDDSLEFAIPAEQLAVDLGISKVSWLSYRSVLERAGLLEVSKTAGGIARGGGYNIAAHRLRPPQAHDR